MESVTIGSPFTPNRATSAGHSPPRRSSMEDADSSVTRKRPRLDSGDRAVRSMSADRVTAIPRSSEHTTVPAVANKDKALNHDMNEKAAAPFYDRTASKVTINVRDPAQNGLSSITVANGAHVPITADKDEKPASNQTSIPGKVETEQPDIISVASTPTRSPEIEVAEVEDINQEPGETKWRSLTHVMDGKDVQDALLSKFPYIEGNRDLRNTVLLISQALEKSE